MTAATDACARCGRTDARLSLTSRGRLCPDCRAALVAAKTAGVDEPSSDWQTTAPSSDWRATRVTELTGRQLVTAVAWGVVKGFGIWALIGAVVALIFAALAHS